MNYKMDRKLTILVWCSVLAFACLLSVVSTHSQNDTPTGKGIIVHPGDGVEFQQVDFIMREAEREISNWGRVEVNPQTLLRETEAEPGRHYLNVVTEFGWVVQNLFVELGKTDENPKAPLNTVATYFMLYESEDQKAYASLQATVFLSPQPLLEPIIEGIEEYKMNPYIWSAEGVSEEFVKVIPQPPRPLNPERFQLDLGITQHTQPNTVNVQAAVNQCVPMAVANSLQYLEERFGLEVPHDHVIGLRGDNSLVGQLDETMDRSVTNRRSGSGMWFTPMLEGKFKYLSDNGLENELIQKHQGRGWGTPPNQMLPAGDFTSSDITSNSEGDTVSIGWVFDQIKQGEDVEIIFSYDDASGNPTGGHAVRAFECGTTFGIPWLGIVHDSNQYNDDAGLERVRYFVLDLDGDGMPNLGSRNWEIRFAFSESIKEKPTPTPVIEPTDTPTPTMTPTRRPIIIPTFPIPFPTFPFDITPQLPNRIIITDNLQSSKDLTGSLDEDSDEQRDLVLLWDYEASIKSSAVIYVESADQSRRLLGWTDDASEGIFEWAEGNKRLNPKFAEGPSSLFENGETVENEYQFLVYFIPTTEEPQLGYPIPSGVVRYITGTVPIFPQEKVIVTDTGASNDFEDLSNGVDVDRQDNRELVIRWNYGNKTTRDTHIYVSVNGRPQLYLGRTGPGTSSDSFSWNPDRESRFINEAFDEGPLPGNQYKFNIYILPENREPPVRGHFTHEGPVEFQVEGVKVTPTKLPPAPKIPVNSIQVFDHIGSNINLVGDTDSDPEDDRELTLRWNLGSVSDIKEYHIYVSINSENEFEFLARQAEPKQQFLRWRPGNSDIVGKLRSGPEGKNNYRFRVFALTESGLPRVLGPLNTKGQVDYEVETGTPEETPTLTPTPVRSPTPTLTPTQPAQKDDLYISLDEVPVEVKRRALQMIAEVGGSEMAPEWETANLKNKVGKFYRPDLEEPAYLEFQVNPSGYLLLSTGEHDAPISDWNTSSKIPRSELILRLAEEKGGSVSRLYRVDSAGYVAENERGEMVAQFGELPRRIHGAKEEWLEMVAEDKFELTEVAVEPVDPTSKDTEKGPQEFKTTVEGPEGSPLEFSSWETWSEMKDEYREYFDVFLETQRMQAEPHWTAIENIRESGEGLLPGETKPIVLLEEKAEINFTGPGTEYIEHSRVGRGSQPTLLISVLKLPPEEERDFNLEITYTNERPEKFLFFIANPEQIIDEDDELTVDQGGRITPNSVRPQGWGSWSSWTYYWAGSHNDQRLYDQFQMSNCLSGCGATAWAMLFGWADHQAWTGNSYWAPRWGLYRANGGYGSDADAPRNQTSGIENIIREIRGYIDTFCAFNSGATAPWDMGDASAYFSGRTGTSLYSNYNGVGIPESRLRKKARNSIRDRNTPAIIGTGWLKHYPLAYGYAWKKRVYRIFGRTVYTQYSRYFYVNNGWGSSSHNDWVKAKTWYAGRIKP